MLEEKKKEFLALTEASAQDAGGSYCKHILLCTTSVAYDIIFLVSKEYPIAKVQVALVLQSHTFLLNCDQHLLHLIFKFS